MVHKRNFNENFLSLWVWWNLKEICLTDKGNYVKSRCHSTVHTTKINNPPPPKKIRSHTLGISENNSIYILFICLLTLESYNKVATNSFYFHYTNDLDQYFIHLNVLGIEKFAKKFHRNLYVTKMCWAVSASLIYLINESN